MTYPVAIVERHAEFSQGRHLPTRHERQDLPPDHPPAPSTRADRLAIDALLRAVNEDPLQASSMSSEWPFVDVVHGNGRRIASSLLQKECLETVGCQSLFQKGDESW